MNPFNILGKRFNDVQHLLNHAGIKNVHDELDDGEAQQFHVSAKDGAWELSLGNNLHIETIFINEPDKFSTYLGFSSVTEISKLEKIYGTSSVRRNQANIPFLGLKGALARFDNEKYLLHIEYEIDSTKIKMVTLMLPEVMKLAC